MGVFCYLEGIRRWAKNRISTGMKMEKRGGFLLKKKSIVLPMICFLALMVCGCTQSESGKAKTSTQAASTVGKNTKNEIPAYLPKKKLILYGPDNPNYRMNVSYDSKKHVVKGDMTVKFTNNLDHALHHVYFNLWPNASAFKGGGIQVSDVKYNGKKAKFQVNKTKLELSDLYFGEAQRASVSMKFTVKLPKKQDRFGWSGKTSSFGNWFPILAVYDNEGWNLDPYFNYGESFYSLTGNFDVKVTTDDKEVVAATGQQEGKVKKANGKAHYHFTARNVRDFAMEMNPNYHKETSMIDGIRVNVFYTDEQKTYAGDFMSVASEALNAYDEKYGRYAWNELDIVSMKGWFGGMEYPQLVMISLQDDSSPRHVHISVAHEIAHQWFYGAVGDNEYDDPWLDESFATFSSWMSYVGLINEPQLPYPAGTHYHLTSPVSAFVKNGIADSDNYYNVIYNYGASTLSDLRKKLGNKVFYRAMHMYYEKEKFKIATTSDFVRIMEETSGKDLTKFFKDHHIYINEKEK